MSRKRRTFRAAVRAKVALAAAENSPISKRVCVSAGQVTAWPMQVTEMVADGRKRRPEEVANEHEHYEQIGGLTMVAEWVKKPAEVKRRCIAPEHESLSVTRQCKLLGLARSICYHAPRSESAENLALMRAIDGLYLSRPLSSSRAVCKHFSINRKQAHRPLRLESISPNWATSRPAIRRRVCPYLLRNLDISQPNLVRASGIASVPM